MAIKIFWTDFAKKELKKIFDYYKVKAGSKVSIKLITNIIESTEILIFQTDIGQKEELLLDRIQNFRYLVYKNYKIIYWYNKEKNRIEISDVFDARQNPIKIKRRK
ncbi:type II toxin-antitoxin system RelE/ParE family toxin [Elizabethkingia sp. HX WHF]|uniref:type II toxin-antitoxin system RelE/ParE family toxin n=1 Tax=Elizabethkingia TaxID=308865 RepID=UPI0005DA39B8|nr:MULTISPECIES: type II toxin-antitoxin system RelE/ParE family toxin [Elizabethkingia]AJW65368.1 Plasmid stabilization system protein [Elizabethkingia miricola]ATL43287.1 type II toxin-antitoxin system RelE/ParE family toxin [Elizabethkingia miricola]MCL1638645.1 type II toxin-antitoxin system RelE/ParE family toxin [Elizabethkingia bruuniana]MDX8564324.1 type II toxin-antitoxin system RelE/ParE family toxin [Elizabethkingia sp. HX WHF]OPC26128.1 plasmid stabilization protein [Elizabethkingi